MDPGAQVLQALVGVPTTVRSGVFGVRPADNDAVLRLAVVQQPESGTGPVDWNGASTTEGKRRPGCQNHLGMVWQEFGVEMDGGRVREV